jgi:8-oxo-dGTP diphosphatase
LAIEVVAAVIQRPDGAFLLAQRPAGKLYAGYWEFPGGKVEPGEPLREAIARELHEELGIEVRRAHPWITRVFDYPHGTVRLNFFRVVAWDGEPHPREAQEAIAWQRLGGALVSPMLPANGPVLAALALPAEYAVTSCERYGPKRMLELVEARIEGGLELLQVREPGLPAAERRRFTEQVLALAHRHGCKVMTKEPVPGAHGLHFTAAGLMRLHERPVNMLAAASCHTREEVAQATRLDLDFIAAGPVRASASHPDAPALGWEKFSSLVRHAAMPVYAIGGLRRRDLQEAMEAGAHGIAMIGGAWED